MGLGQRIRARREALGLSQARLGEAVGVSLQAVSSWERDEYLPDTARLPLIARALGLTPGQLMEERPEAGWDADDRLFDEERMYTCIQAAARAKGLSQTLRALPFAREKHANQVRKGASGIPYIIHPLTMCCQALALGLDEDDLLSALLLHDVVEDCGVKPEELPLGEAARETVRLLSKDKSHELDEEGYDKTYFAGIATHPHAMLVKLLDRCHNLSVMAGGFTVERMLSYAGHTRDWVLPLADRLRAQAPRYADACFLLKYQMLSLIHTVRRLLAP